MEALGYLIILAVLIGVAIMVWRTRRTRGNYMRPDARHHSGAAAPADHLDARTRRDSAPADRPDVHPGLSPAQELQGAPARAGPENDDSLIETQEVDRERAQARTPDKIDERERSGRDL